MHLSYVLGLFAAGAAAAPSPAAAAPQPTCSPYNYPATLNSTAPSAFFLQVRSNNPLTNGRNIQLRGDDPKAPQVAVVDASSPVLLAQLRGGVMHTQNRTENNILYDLGPASRLWNVSTTPTQSLQEFSFVNATAASPATADFELVNVSQDAQYNLYHQIHLDLIVNGFAACQKDGYWQLFYYTYSGSEPIFGSDCEYVGVQTVVAPEIPW